jgi:rhamnosyltransferase
MTFAGAPHAKIAAIVILYLPTEKTLFRLLKSLQDTVEHIYIVDNTPTKQISWVSSLWFACNSFQVRYLSLGDNFGIAKAQNVGIEMAIQRGCDHVILFDQDSEASPGMVATLLAEECLLLSQDVKVGSVGPAFIDEKTGDYTAAAKQGWFFVKRIPIQAGDTKPISVDVLIASGTLIRTQVLKDVGMMMEELFIDWVDIEWALRAGRYHYAHFMIPKAIMHHTIGDDFVDIGVRKVNIHSDFRKFYIIRNACFLLTTREMQFKWRVNTAFKISAHMLIYLVTSKNKIKLLRLMFSAIISGFSGRLGKQFFMIPMS